MTVLPRSRLSGIVDRLYRWRWWILVLLLPLGLAVGDDPSRPWAWVVFGLFGLLLWLPVLVRWARAGRDASGAFRTGLDAGGAAGE